MMFATKKKTNEIEGRQGRSAEYATAEEFCAIFNQEMESFYKLAYLLTASHSEAEECVAGALLDCHSAQVFKAWAQSWAKLAVVERAIRTVRSAAGTITMPNRSVNPEEEFGRPELAPILRLKTLERFVYVLTVLDRYSVRDCAILLKCSRPEIERAKLSAIASVSAANVAMLSTQAQLLAKSISA